MAGALALCLCALSTGAASAALPDGRGWELVSPADKGGAAVSAPTEAPAGSFKAAAQGGRVAFSSRDSFANPAGATPHNPYISTRGTGSWDTDNITPAHLAGAYESSPYLAYSEDLSTGLLLNPRRCDDGDPCPAGFKLIDSASGAVLASLEDSGEFQGASANLRHVVLLRGTDLYLWSPPSTSLAKLNTDPADSLPSLEGAISPDGTFIFFKGADGNLYLRVAPAAIFQVDTAQGGGGVFEGASEDGQVAFFSKAGHLYRYPFLGTATRLSTLTDFSAFLGTDANAQTAYYRSATAIFRWTQGSGPTQILTNAALTDVSRETSDVTANANRLYLTTTATLLIADISRGSDVYQWQTQGSGSCTQPAGCTDLISPGFVGSSILAGASDDGADVYFTTESSLAWNDQGSLDDFAASLDLYDARIGGGFPTPQRPVVCEGDTCQGIVLPFDDPIPGTARGMSPPNPPAHYVKLRGRRTKRRCARGKVRKGAKCVKKRKGGRR